MLEALKAHPTLYVVVIALAYLAGGATMFAAICTYVLKYDVVSDAQPHECPIHPKHVMEIDADRDKIAEAVGVIS